MRATRKKEPGRAKAWTYTLVLVLGIGLWSGTHSGGLFAQPPTYPAGLRLHQLTLTVEGSQKTLALRFSRPPASVQAFALSSPPRLVVDVRGPVKARPSAIYPVEDSLLRRVRVGFHPQHLRFVLDWRGELVPPFVVEQQGTLITAVLNAPGGKTEAAHTQVLFTLAETGLMAQPVPKPSEPLAQQPSPPEAAQRSEREQASLDLEDTTAAGLSADEPQTGILSALGEQIAALWERTDVYGFVENETAFRLYSPRQFSKVQNWFEVEVDSELTQWAVLKIIARTLADPVNHLETNIRDFDASPIDRWEMGNSVEAELRELYFEITLGDFDVRLGRQQIVWGESLGLRILDVINPQDFREFILDDFIDARIPLWGARIDYALRNWTLEGIFLLDFEANRAADQGSEFQFRNIPMPALPIEMPFPPFPAVQVTKVKEPRDGRFSDAEVGLRVSRFLRSMDVSLNYFYTWDDFPTPFRRIIGPNTFLIEPTHKRLHLLGGSFNYAFDVFVIRGEGVVNFGKYFVSEDPNEPDGVHKRDFLLYVLGFDWTVSDNLLLNAQFFQTAILGKPSDVPDKTVSNALSLFLRSDFWNETLFPQFIVIYGINFGDLLVRPQISYQMTDLLSFTLGMDFFVGSRSGFFGQYAAPVNPHHRYHTGRNNRIFLEIKRSFDL